MAKQKPGWRPVFLEELAKWGVVEHACHLAGIRRSAACKARQDNPSFAEEWDEAKAKIVGTLEVLARQRATVGELKPVYFQGKKIDSIREVDNTGLRWLLSKLKPEVYAEKPQDVNMKHSGDVGLNVTGSVDVKLYTDDELRTLDEIHERTLARAGQNGAGKT